MNLKEKMNLLNNNAEMNDYIYAQMKCMKLYGSNVVDIKRQLMEYKMDLKSVNEELKEVRALGDLSENPDYYYLRDERKYLEDRIQAIEADLKLFTILNSGEEEILRKKLTEQYLKEEKENYQRVMNISIPTFAKSFIHPSFYRCYGREDMGDYSVNPNELLEAGHLVIVHDDDFNTLLLYTPKEQWAKKLTEFVDELLKQTAFLHACYALREAKRVAEVEPDFWNDKLENWLSSMEKGDYYTSSGVLVGKSKHQLDGHTIYFRYTDDQVETTVYPAIHEVADEDVEVDIFSKVEF